MYRLAEFTVDPHRFELQKDGERLDIQPRALHLLLRLIEARGAMVSKAEIAASVWDGRFVSDSAMSSQVKLLRKVLGDTARPHAIVETVHGQGLRIAAEISRVASPAATVAHSPRVLRPSDDGRPSIAVLPLEVIALSPDLSVLPEAVPDEVITALSKLRWLRVCARGSSFRYRSFVHGSREIGAALGVEYCLAGSVECVQGSLRLVFELSRTVDDSVIWRDRLAAPAAGIHELRQELVMQVAARIEEEVSQHELDGLRGQDPEGLEPWQAYHLGFGKVFTTAQPDYVEGARLFRKAVAGDPDFARAHAGLAQIHYWTLFQRQAKDEAETVRSMQRAVQRALELDRQDPFCQLMAGRAQLIRHRIDEGLEYLERAKAIAPSYAIAYSGIGSIQALRGESTKALENLQMAIKLSPQDPWMQHMKAALATAYDASGDLAFHSPVVRAVEHGGRCGGLA